MSTTTGLKPCPFCGGDAKLISGFAPLESHFIDCEGCKASSPIFSTAEEAISAWNRRTAAHGEPSNYTYASQQATNCAGCGQHKHTPLRIDAMGGYVCLTCIYQKLGSLLGEFGYEQAGSAESEIKRYSASCSWDGGGAAELEEDSLGDLVLYSDHLKAIAALAQPAQELDETQLAIDLARVAHNSVENGEMRHDVGIALLEVVRKHTAPAPSKAGEWTDEQILKLADDFGIDYDGSFYRNPDEDKANFLEFARALLSAPAQAQSEDAK